MNSELLLLCCVIIAMTEMLASSTPLERTVTLRNGVVMPSVGLGSSGICHPDPDGTESTDPIGCSSYPAAISALNLGYRSFHTALSYDNLAGLGQAIEDSIKLGNITRQELFVMSMVPKYLMGKRETYAAVEAILEQLQLDYLDLIMIHHRAGDIGEWPRNVSKMKSFPDGWAYKGSPSSTGKFSLWQPPNCSITDGTWVQCQDETWEALLDLKAQGKIRAIGVSNWQLSNLKRMASLGQELPTVNQIELHIGWHDDEMLDWCNEHQIVLQAASPISRGVILTNEVVLAMAAKYNKSAAQVAIRWLLDKGISPIPGATDPLYQEENFDVFDFKLQPTDVALLGSLGIPCRGPPKDGLQKCWADPAVIMCGDAKTGRMFHCP